MIPHNYVTLQYKNIENSIIFINILTNPENLYYSNNNLLYEYVYKFRLNDISYEVV